MTALRLGARSATAVVAVGATYAVVLALGMARHGLSEPITDPILAIMELLTIASALPLLSMFVALHACVEPPGRPWATLALCCASMFALATIGVHDDPRSRRLRHWLRVTGLACLVGLIGPIAGDMRLQLIGVFGYAVLLPIVAWMSVGWFGAPERRDHLHAA